MNIGRTVFAQLMDHLPAYEFQKCVTRYRGDYQQKSFSCWDQFLTMAFAQLTYRESLRDIEACLRSMRGSCITWDSAASYRVPPWLMPTSRATGESTPISPKYSSASRGPCMLTIRSAWIWMKPCTLWTQPPSTSACRYFPGPDFASTRPP